MIREPVYGLRVEDVAVSTLAVAETGSTPLAGAIDYGVEIMKLDTFASEADKGAKAEPAESLDGLHSFRVRVTPTAMDGVCGSYVDLAVKVRKTGGAWRI